MSVGALGGGSVNMLLILAFFVIGTYNTVITKVLFTARSIGKDGNSELFLKPAFGNWTMFVGMSFSLLAYRWQKKSPRLPVDSGNGLDQALLAAVSIDAVASPPSWRRRCLLVAVPAMCDLIAMGASLVGIILIPASIWQMLRGAEVVFAAILTYVFLKRELYGFHWLGVSIASAGILAVSVATLLGGSIASDPDRAEGSGSSGNSMVALGIALTLGSQVITAAQIIIEEQLLTDLDFDPLLVVGLEGVWGTLAMSFIVYPLLWFLPGPDHGHAEDVVDTIALVQNSSLVLFIGIADMISCVLYNIIGMKVTAEMSGVMRTMLEATRTMMVWVFNLGWHYLVDPRSQFGESWTSWSWLELAGFILLLLGQATYSEKLRWPGLVYPPDEHKNEAAVVRNMMSPAAIKRGVLPSPQGSGLRSRCTSTVAATS